MFLFIAFAAPDDANCQPELIDMINARFDSNLFADDVTDLGKTILETERAFNLATGFTSKDDRLTEYFREEPLRPPDNVVSDIDWKTLDSFRNF